MLKSSSHEVPDESKPLGHIWDTLEPGFCCLRAMGCGRALPLRTPPPARPKLLTTKWFLGAVVDLT